MGGTGEGSPRESELKRQKLEPQHEEDVTEKATNSSDDVEDVEGSMEAIGGEDPKAEKEEDEDEGEDEEEDEEEDDDKIETVIKNYEGEDKCVYIDSDVDEEEEDDNDMGEGEEEDDDDDEEVARYWKQVEDSDGFYVDHVPKARANFLPRFCKVTLHDDISYDKKLEKLASIAVEVYNHQKAANLKFEKLLFATLRGCGTGLVFYITFSANNLANHKAATYQSRVCRGFHSHGRCNVEVLLFRRKPKW